MNKVLMWILIVVGVLGFLAINIIGAAVVFERTVLEAQVARKPAIYLYPEVDSFISVKVDINGKMIADIPEYNDGWNVFATKEGIIEDKYDYLFYEAELKKIDLPDEGWIVEYRDLEYWFNTNLPKLGLNEKEKEQFMEYWMNELTYSEYYDIRILSNDFLEDNMNLIIEPNPDNMIRLNFYFTPLSEKVEIKEPLINAPNRNGFTVVEWGGVLAE